MTEGFLKPNAKTAFFKAIRNVNSEKTILLRHLHITIFFHFHLYTIFIFVNPPSGNVYDKCKVPISAT